MKHYLSICAIFKNEAPYLEEWLRFHTLVGVDHFYLFNNDSADESLAILAPWLAAGRVTLYQSPGFAMQLPSYRHCITAHAADSVWIAFIDVDEFLFAPQNPDLRDFLRPYESEAGVVANWLMFGANGHQTRPGGLTTLNFTRRCDVDLCTFESHTLRSPGLDPHDPANHHKICAQIKSIVNTRDVTDFGKSPHDFRYRDGRVPVNANRQPVRGAFCDDLSALQQLRINHYFSRSLQELQQKLQRGKADGGFIYNAPDLIRRNLMFDQVEDLDILPLARRIEADMLAKSPL
jgi:hypothetical protein